MNLSRLIDKKEQMAQYMIDEITHICKTFEKRAPGSKGEQQACEYMADVLKKDCGCQKVEVEPFKENPGSFYGWIFITITLVLAAVAIFFFAPIISLVMILIGLAVVLLEFGFYKKPIDPLFKEKTGHNVTAIKKCAGETKRRII